MAFVDTLKSEPVRIRGYALVVLVTTFLVARGVVDALSAEFIVSLVGSVLAVETSRAAVSPVAVSD